MKKIELRKLLGKAFRAGEARCMGSHESMTQTHPKFGEWYNTEASEEVNDHFLAVERNADIEVAYEALKKSKSEDEDEDAPVTLKVTQRKLANKQKECAGLKAIVAEQQLSADTHREERREHVNELIELRRQVKDLTASTDTMWRSLESHKLFIEGLTRAETKDQSFHAMMQWKPELCYEMAGTIGDHSKARKFLYGE